VAAAGSRSAIAHVEDRKGQVRRLCADADLAARLFGWSATMPLAEGIARNIAWARENERPEPGVEPRPRR
jgi:UDP-glucuronate 4-epimerase